MALVSGQRATFSIGPQPGWFFKDSYDPDVLNWYKLRTNSIGVGIIQGMDMTPPETGGPLTPTSMFKTNTFFAGEVDFIPRAEGVLGWILAAMLGKSETEDDDPVAGMYRHTFTFDEDPSKLPLLSVRKEIPDHLGGYGETGVDCFLTNATLFIPSSGQIAATFGIFGLRGLITQDPDWEYTNVDFDSHATIPMSNRGFVRIAGEQLNATSMVLEVMNAIEDEDIIGSYESVDMIPISRSATLRVTVNYKRGLYSQVMTGSKSGGEWNPLPFTTENGVAPGFEAEFESAIAAVGTTPYKLNIKASRVQWQASSPVAAGGEVIQQELIGMIIEPETGDEYLEVTLDNTTEAYPWPEAPVVVLASAALPWAKADGAKVLDAAATVESDLANFDGGVLLIETQSNNTATTVLSITNGAIGTIDATNDGTAGKPLQVALSSGATPAAVQTALRSVTFDDTAVTPAPGFRSIHVTLYDGNGGYGRRAREVHVQN
jgi:hypothetical protein